MIVQLHITYIPMGEWTLTSAPPPPPTHTHTPTPQTVKSGYAKTEKNKFSIAIINNFSTDRIFLSKKHQAVLLLPP